jgi:hypothetical protein
VYWKSEPVCLIFIAQLRISYNCADIAVCFQHERRELMAGELTPMRSQVRLPFIIESRYDFTLVCDVCYPQRRPGHGGFVALIHLPHDCQHDQLVVRQKNHPEARWAKIRPRDCRVRISA